MTLSVSLSPQAESKHRERAAALGQPVDVYASHVLEQMAAGRIEGSDQDTLAVLRAWNLEDQTDDPVEIAARQRDWEEFAASISAHHASSRKVYP